MEIRPDTLAPSGNHRLNHWYGDNDTAPIISVIYKWRFDSECE